MLGIEQEIKCPYCGIKAEWCENKVIYGKNYGKSYMCYYCKDCDSYVGCHNNSRNPLGTMANKELRIWRIKAHAVIDPIWKANGHNRRLLYQKLNVLFGKEFHIGDSTIQDCKCIIENQELLKMSLKKLKKL